jgi:hypothetical protein
MQRPPRRPTSRLKLLFDPKRKHFELSATGAVTLVIGASIGGATICVAVIIAVAKYLR